jgi:hypothetical protein
MTKQSEILDLYEVASDHEKDVLDELRHKAGHVWTCRGPHPEGQPDAWTNDAGEACDICHRPAPRTAAHLAWDPAILKMAVDEGIVTEETFSDDDRSLIVRVVADSEPCDECEGTVADHDEHCSLHPENIQ